MVKFRIGYISPDNIVITIEHPEFGFEAPVIWFNNWDAFREFRDMIDKFYQQEMRRSIPLAFLKEFEEDAE